MDTYIRFLFEFMSVFFKGIGMIVGGFFKGIIQIFSIQEYLYVIEFYRKDFKVAEWILVIVAVIVMIIMLALIVLLIVLFIRKYFKFRKTLVEQESMLKEIGELNREVATLVEEKEKILAMKVSQLGLKPGEEATITSEEDVNTEDSDNLDGDLDSYRFSKLHAIDLEYRDYKVQQYGNTFTLEELVEIFRNFAASKLKLYYTTNMIRLFISGLSATKLVILQGISGTGKTSLAYAWGKFIKNDAIIASVQPSWRDRTELFGYFNEFTKKFNETEVLKGLYLAGYTDDVYVTVLDEMNIARVEYYFAEMLSILEMPSRDEWIIELVPSVWDNDPKMLHGGKFMPIDINDKGQVFEPTDTDAMNINSSYLEGLFADAKAKYPLTSEMEQKINDMDDYVIKHFRIAFGNRIVKQMKDFVATYVACGGTEVDGVDYYIARKILRKFEQLNLAYIRDEIDPFIDFLDKSFGKEHFNECKDYLLRLKKMV